MFFLFLFPKFFCFYFSFSYVFLILYTVHIYECFLVVTVAPMHLSSIYLKFMENPNPGPMATPSGKKS